MAYIYPKSLLMAISLLGFFPIFAFQQEVTAVDTITCDQVSIDAVDGSLGPGTYPNHSRALGNCIVLNICHLSVYRQKVNLYIQ